RSNKCVFADHYQKERIAASGDLRLGVFPLEPDRARHGEHDRHGQKRVAAEAGLPDRARELMGEEIDYDDAGSEPDERAEEIAPYRQPDGSRDDVDDRERRYREQPHRRDGHHASRADRLFDLLPTPAEQSLDEIPSHEVTERIGRGCADHAARERISDAPQRTEDKRRRQDEQRHRKRQEAADEIGTEDDRITDGVLTERNRPGDDLSYVDVIRERRPAPGGRHRDEENDDRR